MPAGTRSRYPGASLDLLIAPRFSPIHLQRVGDLEYFVAQQERCLARKVLEIAAKDAELEEKQAELDEKDEYLLEKTQEAEELQGQLDAGGRYGERCDCRYGDYHERIESAEQARDDAVRENEEAQEAEAAADKARLAAEDAQATAEAAQDEAEEAQAAAEDAQARAEDAQAAAEDAHAAAEDALALAISELAHVRRAWIAKVDELRARLRWYEANVSAAPYDGTGGAPKRPWEGEDGEPRRPLLPRSFGGSDPILHALR
ncbi:hypothetical protein JCM10449v2_003646 [Rhodotorula kratochvilovae]